MNAITRATQETIDAVNAFPGITLTDLQTEAAFLTRHDRKYLVPEESLGLLLAGIDPTTRVLEIDGQRSFGYLTPYFDDRNYAAYLSAARRRPNRFKVRTRLYTDSGICLLEVKTRDARGRTVKERIAHDENSLLRISDSECVWLSQFPQVARYAHGLRHCITTRYQRTTLMLANGAGRITIDRDLEFSRPDGEARMVQGLLIIETKGAGGATHVDHLLWRMGYRPESMSKFASGLSLLVPDLPANHWHRLRTRLNAASACVSTTQSAAGTSPQSATRSTGS